MPRLSRLRLCAEKGDLALRVGGKVCRLYVWERGLSAVTGQSRAGKRESG
jgi:hypothetical protein